MSKRSLLLVAGIVGLSWSVSAQPLQGLGQTNLAGLGLTQSANSGSATGLSSLFGTLNGAWYGPTPLSFADGRLFSFPTAFAWTEALPADFISPVLLAALPRVSPASAGVQEWNDGKSVPLAKKVTYSHGEVGFLYGRSGGKFGREIESGYIVNELVEGDTHVFFGASYEHSTGRLPVRFPDGFAR